MSGASGEEELRVQTHELEAALEEVERQRRRYRDLFDHAPLPYLTTDAAGRILEANQAAAALLGMDRDRVTGQPLPLLLAGDDEIHDRIRRLADGQLVPPWEAEVRPGQDGGIAVEVTARPLDLGGGPASEIQWVLQDVRPRRESQDRERDLHREQAARAALEQVAGRARFLSDASARLMGVLDPPRVWRLGAELAGEHSRGALLLEAEEEGAAVRVRGVGGSGALRQELDPLLDRVLPWDSRAVAGVPLAPIRSAMERGEPEVITDLDTPPDSSGASLAVPIRSPTRTLGVLVVWLHERARIGEELLVSRNLADRIGLALESADMFQEVVQSRRDAEAANTAEADFLSIVSHELRTPLTAIISYAELLENRASELPDKLERYAHQIAAAADHQRQLVEQILAYKRVQREGVAVELEELDYRKVARSAVAMVQPQVGDRPVEVVPVLPGAPVRGVSDRGKLQQILTNLLSNAVRHTAEGHVRLIVEARHPWVIFRIEDTGEGIGPEELPRIFDRFWRGGGEARTRGGSGLGLTITRELVNRLSGEIEVESEPGVGTTFTVRIPRAAGTRKHDGSAGTLPEGG